MSFIGSDLLATGKTLSMMTRKLLSAAMAASFLTAASAVPALAQAQADATGEYQLELTEAKLGSFVDAALEIDAVVTEVQPQLQAAETQEAQVAIQENAQARMAQIVAESGLSVNEYNAIANAARSNPEVASRIQAMAEARRG